MKSENFRKSCALYPGSNQTFRVDYFQDEGRWLPLPVNVCDNSGNESVCRKCATEVYRLALQKGIDPHSLL